MSREEAEDMILQARLKAGWIEALMPPVVTGAVVAVIGLNLAPIAAKGAMGQGTFDAVMALVTIVCVGGIAVFTRGMVQRLLILVGLVLACVIYAICANGLGMGKPIDFSGVAAAAWLGLPHFAAPVFQADAMGLIVPVAIILVAENLGHVKAVSAMTGRDMDRYLGRAFIGTALCLFLAGVAYEFAHHLIDGVAMEQALVARWLMAWGDAFITGMLVSIFVAFVPEWLATWSDRRYLGPGGP